MQIDIVALGVPSVEGALCEADSAGEILDRRTVSSPGSVTLHPRDTTREIFFCDAALWSERLTAPFREQAQQLLVGPAGAVTGALLSDEEPSAVSVRLAAAGTPLEKSDPRHILSARCDRKAMALRCRVPAGRWLAQFVSGELVATALQRIEISAGKSLDLGEIVLRRGGIVGGRVEPAPRSRLIARIEPDRSQMGEPLFSADGPPELLASETSIGGDGSFTFSAVAPGTYELTIVDTLRAILSRSRFTLQDSAPIELDPVSLAEPTPLRIAISPSTDPAGEPWHLQVVTADGRRIEERVTGISETAVYPGRWWVSVLDSQDVPWDERWVDIEPGESAMELSFEFEAVVVSGELTLAGRPVAGSIYFGGTESAPRIEVESDEEGLFRCVLPRPGEWSIRVTVPEAGVRRWLKGIEVEPDETGAAALAIHLPGGCIAGWVLFADGQPASGAQVRIIDEATTAGLASSEESGDFRACGIDDGPYAVEAEHRFAEARVSPVNVASEDTTYLDLVLERVPTTRIRLSESSGAIGQFTAVVAGNGRSRSATSRAGQGNVEVGLFAGASGVVIKAPGRPIRLIDPHDLASGDYTVEFAEVGGELELYSGNAIGDPGSNMTLTIKHDGAALDHDLFFPLVDPQVEGNRLTVPNLQPGVYEICISGAQCAVVSVSAGGSSTVDIGQLSGGS